MTPPANTPQGNRRERRLRRGRRASTSVALVMALVTIVSILIVGAFNLVTAANLLNNAVEAQLINVGQSRMSRLESGVESLSGIVVSMADGASIPEALTDLTGTYRSLDERLSAAEHDELRSAYTAELKTNTGLPSGYGEVAVDDVFPQSETAQYLQYHYLAQNPFPNRSALDDAGDGSEYSRAHALHHPSLRSLAETQGVGDLMLIDAESATVVYTVEKRTDLGTSLMSGPYRDSALANAVLSRLPDASAEEAVLVDFEPYAPAHFAPTAFMVAAIRDDDGKVIGALAVEIRQESLDSIATANRDWAGTGLGETGEVYIVGSDSRMRTDSRLWLEDPDRYLNLAADAGYSSEILDAIIAFDTTVLIQPAETDAVAASLHGARFSGTTTNYLDQGTLAVSRELDIEGVEWVGVAEVTTAEAQAPLRRHFVTVLALLVLLIPIVIILAAIIARRLLRPVGQIARAADRVRAGDLDVDVEVRSNDEFGALAGTFNSVVATLRQQAAELKQAEVETTEMLQAVMPPRLAAQYQSGDHDISESLRNATLVVILVDEPVASRTSESEAIVERSVALSSGISTLVERYGLEQIVASATQYVAVAGLDVEDDEAGKAVAFAVAVRSWLDEAVSNTGVPIQSRIGLASGDVVTGVVGTERLAYNVWGRPRRRAATLASVARPNEILVDPTVANHVKREWAVDPVLGLVGLDGDALDGWRVVGKKGDSGYN